MMRSRLLASTDSAYAAIYVLTSKMRLRVVFSDIGQP
jgi:hypothetical protein